MGSRHAKRPSPSGRLPAFLVFCAVVALGAAWFLNVSGPLEGWLDRLLKARPETPAAPAAPEAPRTEGALDAEQDHTGNAPEPGTAPNDLETRYRTLVSRYLAELPRHEPGADVTLRLVDGRKIKGTLKEVKPGRILLTMQYGTMSYPIHRISERDVDRLFPERTAHRRALAALHRELTPVPEQEQPGTRQPDTAISGGAATPSEPGDGQLVYDPSRQPTPESLRPTLEQFAQWLEMQHRRVGGRIADGLFAKEQGRSAVLYVRLNESFAEQDYDTRFAIAEGMQQVWGLRCLSNGVVRKATDAHIVLLDGRGDIAGGSTQADATAVWVPAK